jgi:hypothetical protein
MTTPDIAEARRLADRLALRGDRHELRPSAAEAPAMLRALAAELERLQSELKARHKRQHDAEALAGGYLLQRDDAWAELERLRAQVAPSLDLMEAVDNVLTLAECECPHSMRFDRGEHMSGCYLFDLNLAYIAAPPAAPAQQADTSVERLLRHALEAIEAGASAHFVMNVEGLKQNIRSYLVSMFAPNSATAQQANGGVDARLDTPRSPSLTVGEQIEAVMGTVQTLVMACFYRRPKADQDRARDNVRAALSTVLTPAAQAETEMPASFFAGMDEGYRREAWRIRRGIKRGLSNPAAQGVDELPPLPKHLMIVDAGDDDTFGALTDHAWNSDYSSELKVDAPMFTAGQMQDYARAAVTQSLGRAHWNQPGSKHPERVFAEWLNERRMADVSSVFHEIVARYRAALAQAPAAEPLTDARDAARYRRWRDDYADQADEPVSDLMTALADAWTPDQVDAAIDTALAQAPTAKEQL